MVGTACFLVTFTLPAELRGQFFGPHAHEAYDLFFTAVSRALSEKLAAEKGLRAAVHGPLKIMFPMVGAVDEMIAARERLAGIRAELERARRPAQ